MKRSLPMELSYGLSIVAVLGVITGLKLGTTREAVSETVIGDKILHAELRNDDSISKALDIRFAITTYDPEITGNNIVMLPGDWLFELTLARNPEFIPVFDARLEHICPDGWPESYSAYLFSDLNKEGPHFLTHKDDCGDLQKRFEKAKKEQEQKSSGKETNP